MSEIEALTLRMREIGHQIDFWNNVMLVSLAGAAIAAIIAFVATRIIVTRTGEFTTAQELLSTAKDRQLQLDLKEKDIEIGNLTVRSDTAEGGIARANERAAKANRAAEDERLARLKLEAQIAPRRLTEAQRKTIADACIPFKQKRVQVVSYMMDTEGFVLSEQIVSALRLSGMTVDDNSFSVMPLGQFTLGVAVYGKDPEFAKSLAQIFVDSGGLASSPTDKDPTEGNEKIIFDPDPAHAAVILVGLRPIERMNEVFSTTHAPKPH